jgi:ABC-type spermidine/putrescine transport system permease subunit I
MTLSERDRRFLERRRERTHVGLFVLPLVLLGFVALWVTLFIYWPLAINPMYAAMHYEGQVVEKGTLTTYAITVTILLNVLLLAVSLAVCFAVLWARSERRYLRLLMRLVAMSPKPGEAVPPAAKPK